MNTKKLSILSLVLLIIQLVTANMVFAVTNYVSINEEWNGGSWWAAVQMWIMQDVDLLDDDWRSQFTSFASFETYTFSGDTAWWIQANYGTSYFDMMYTNGSIVRIERVDADAMTITWSVSASNSNPKIVFMNSNNTLQDSAPKPYTFSGAWYWNESSWWSSSSRNAVLFTFSWTPIDWFWVRLGDTESRSDGEWTEAEIEYFDSQWVLVWTWGIVAAAWVDQSLCWWSNASNSASACGNETTRYVWFKKSSPTEDIKYMRVIVWDDDDINDAGTTDGNTEHLSFMWSTIVEDPIPDLWLVKSGSISAMSGDEIGYSLVVTNHGPWAASGVVVEELYPTWFSFTSALPAPSVGNNIWNVWVLGSGANYTIAITWSIAWMTGDYINTARVSAETETWSVANTWSHTTSLVCDVDFGSECQWEANVCGGTISWTISCDGTCDAIAATDPVGLWLPCNAWLGVCSATGVMVCDATWFGVMCNAAPWVPSDTDMCDGLDNDCDGEIDEDFSSIATNCGVGECGASWVTSCVEGAVVDTCEAWVPADVDMCDGLDNDCDGTTDEDFVQTTTTCGVGACQASGTLACIAWVTVDSCAEGEAWVDAVCNGVDDDCDGEIDEDYVVLETTCGVGECGAAWVTSCEAWVETDSCEVWTPAGVDMCDGFDNDCDGEIDEDFAAAVTSCGVGECGATWATSCMEGSVVDGCEEGTPADVDMCDGLDNDCDGTTDEDFVSVETTCGVGECGAVWVISCVEGSVVDSCEVWTPSVELCDTLDNNCDGKVDEWDVCVVPLVSDPETIDLTISVVCSPEIAQSWETISCDVVYENLWDTDAQDTNISIDFPENIDLTSLPVIPWVTCVLGSIDCGGDWYTLWAGESVGFSFDGVVSWNSDVVYSVDASISTTTEETNYSNNDDSDAILLYETSNSWWGWTANYCGDGNQVNWEACDDGNNISWDGCSNNCSIEKSSPASLIPAPKIVSEQWTQVIELTQEELEVVEMIVVLQQEVILLNELHAASPTMLPTKEGFALPTVLPKTWASL